LNYLTRLGSASVSILTAQFLLRVTDSVRVMLRLMLRLVLRVMLILILLVVLRLIVVLTVWL
jgi:hypothetical protein